jgi:F-box-like
MEVDEEKVTIDKLPEEVLLFILGFLNSSDLKNVTLVASK